jgi:hypothetical protein
LIVCDPLVQLFALITHRRLRMNTNERVHWAVPIQRTN